MRKTELIIDTSEFLTSGRFEVKSSGYGALTGYIECMREQYLNNLVCVWVTDAFSAYVRESIYKGEIPPYRGIMTSLNEKYIILSHWISRQELYQLGSAAISKGGLEGFMEFCKDETDGHVRYAPYGLLIPTNEIVMFSCD